MAQLQQRLPSSPLAVCSLLRAALLLLREDPASELRPALFDLLVKCLRHANDVPAVLFFSVDGRLRSRPRVSPFPRSHRGGALPRGEHAADPAGFFARGKPLRRGSSAARAVTAESGQCIELQRGFGGSGGGFEPLDRDAGDQHAAADRRRGAVSPRGCADQ